LFSDVPVPVSLVIFFNSLIKKYLTPLCKFADKKRAKKHSNVGIKASRVGDKAGNNANIKHTKYKRENVSAGAV
jgi:hypothetical protein